MVNRKRYYLQTADGRFVTQQGTTPALTKIKGLAYTWNSELEADKLLPKYAAFLNVELTVTTAQ